MSFTLPELPYGYEDLEPFYDAETVKIHHSKHHQTYTNKLNAACDCAGIEKKDVESILKNLNSYEESKRGALRNHAGGYWNHKFFWDSMSPNKQQEERKAFGKVADQINADFGSFEEFKEKFSAKAAAHFGSGWVWLVVNKDNKLEITDSHDQVSPLTDGVKPLLTIDVWEHAYYLKFKNVRPDWIKAWWSIVNWDIVEERYSN